MPSKLRQLLIPIIAEIIKEDLEIPSQDGTAAGASPDDQDRAKKATQDGETVKFVKPGELEEGDVETNEDTQVQVSELLKEFSAIQEEILELESFSTNEGNSKMAKHLAKMSKCMNDAKAELSALRELKDGVVSEQKEKADAYGDKVLKSLGKHIKSEDSGKKLKEKYMPYIEMAYKKGKAPKDVAERIKDHRFEQF